MRGSRVAARIHFPKNGLKAPIDPLTQTPPPTHTHTADATKTNSRRRPWEPCDAFCRETMILGKGVKDEEVERKNKNKRENRDFLEVKHRFKKSRKYRCQDVRVKEEVVLTCSAFSSLP